MRGRDAVPDYARVFPLDRVNRLDISITAANWNALLADMVSLAGTRGAQGGLAVAAAADSSRAAGSPGRDCMFPPGGHRRVRGPNGSRRLHGRHAAHSPGAAFRPARPASWRASRCRVAAEAGRGRRSGAAATRHATTWSCCREIRCTCRPT